MYRNSSMKNKANWERAYILWHTDSNGLDGRRITQMGMKLIYLYLQNILQYMFVIYSDDFTVRHQSKVPASWNQQHLETEHKTFSVKSIYKQVRKLVRIKTDFFRKHLIWEKKEHNGMATMPTNTVNYSNTDNKIKQFWIAISWNIQFQLCVCRMHRIHIWNWKTHWGRSKNGYYLAIHVSKLIQWSSQSLSDNYLSLKLWELNWINYWFWQRPSTRQTPDHYPNQSWIHFKWILNVHLTMYGGTIN